MYKKDYLSFATKSLIGDINNTSVLDIERFTKLRKAVKRRVKKDKRQFICDNLLQDSKGPPSKQWSTLKFIRKPYVPRTQGVLDSSGKICSKNQKAETLAKHLADNVWCSSHHADLNTEPLYPVADLPTTPFTEHELDNALHKMRHKRAPGPDHAPVELWKFAPRPFRLLLLSHYNEVFTTASSPSAWSLAHVVMIFKGKKKDPKLPSNYRPISLVNTVYKVYASVLHTRLKLAIDDRISPSQYGFRSGRSTSAPLFVIRRLLELHERHGVSFYALFLDWAQAFDSVSHSALRISLTRLGVPSAFIEAVMAIYSTAQFQVKDSTSFSARHSFLRGIRQGCPLSPYLFILVLSALMEDVTSSYRSPFGILHSVVTHGIPLTDIEYADDTLLLSRAAQSLNRFLHILQ